MVFLEDFNRYVSEDGRVFSMVRGGKLREMKQHLKRGYNGGYLMTSVDARKTGRHDYPVHRLVAMAFIPNPDGLTEIDHIDRNRQNNSIENLRWVTRYENCMNTGRGQKLRELGIKAGTPEYMKWWTENHAEELKEYHHNRYMENKEKYREKNREYYAEHHEEIRAAQNKYKQRLRNGGLNAEADN